MLLMATVDRDRESLALTVLYSSGSGNRFGWRAEDLRRAAVGVDILVYEVYSESAVDVHFRSSTVG